MTIGFGVNASWIIDRCYFFGHGETVMNTITLATGTGADWDANIVFQNSFFFGPFSLSYGALFVAGSGANANYGGGVIARSCTFLGTGHVMKTNTATLSTTYPCAVTNSLILMNSGAAPLIANAAGQIVEDYNMIFCSRASTNVTLGAHSIRDNTRAPMFWIGQEQIFGMSRKPFLSPMPGSPLLGFGNDGAQTAYDLNNNPRPSGGETALPTIGALERGDSWGKETGTVRTGSNAISITGPGYQDFDVPVDAASTTVGVYFQYDSTYAGTRPQISVLNGEECGVAAASTTVGTGALNDWAQATINFTPTSAGIVTIRLQSNDTNGGGKAFADDFSVA